MLTSATSLFLLATSTAAFDVSSLPRDHQRLAASLASTHPVLARAGHALLDTLTVDQVDQALGDAPYLKKIEAAKRAARAARRGGAKRQSAFDPAECKPTGLSTVETLTSAGLEVSTVEEEFDQQAYFLVEGPATIFIEPRFSVDVVSNFGSYNIDVVDTSCDSYPDLMPTNGTSFEISKNGTVGVRLTLSPFECETASTGINFSLEPEEKTSDCATRTSFSFGVTLGATTSACETCGATEYCDTEDKCVCDNYAGACFNRDDCPAMDPGFDSDGQCSTGYNDKACCTAEGANKAMTSMAASLSLAGIDVEADEYSECWQQVMRPLYCAEKCAADSSMFDEYGSLVQCQSLCEKSVDLCKAFVEKAANGEDTSEINATMCADQPTTDCFSGAASLAVSGLASTVALLALW
jgi:hypothetical protein